MKEDDEEEVLPTYLYLHISISMLCMYVRYIINVTVQQHTIIYIHEEWRYPQCTYYSCDL